MYRLGPGAFSSTLEAQFTPDELYGSEAFYLGGEYSVRGFRHDGAQGDSGVVSRNEYELSLGRLLRLEELAPWSISAFYDQGRVKPRHKDYPKAILAGAGVKLAARYKLFEAAAGYAAVIRKEPGMDDNAALYVNMAFTYAF